MKQLQERRYPTPCPFARLNFALDLLGDFGTLCYFIEGALIYFVWSDKRENKPFRGNSGVFGRERPRGAPRAKT